MSLKSGIINFCEKTRTFSLGDVLIVGAIGRDGFTSPDSPIFSYSLYLRNFPESIRSKDYSTFEEAKQGRDALVEAWVEYMENKEEERQCRR